VVRRNQRRGRRLRGTGAGALAAKVAVDPEDFFERGATRIVRHGPVVGIGGTQEGPAPKQPGTQIDEDHWRPHEDRGTDQAAVRTEPGSLDERGRREWAAPEALALGRGGVSKVHRATGLVASTIGRGMRDIVLRDRSAAADDQGARRIREPGGGRKRMTDEDPSLLSDLLDLAGAITRGDPESPLLWTSKSAANLASALRAMGHDISSRSANRILKSQGYSLHANEKPLAGPQHAGRNAQLVHIIARIAARQSAGNPAISVDTKKEELVGSHKNVGREMRPKASSVKVDFHDLMGELGRASPTSSTTSGPTSAGSTSAPARTPPSTPSSRSGSGGTYGDHRCILWNFARSRRPYAPEPTRPSPTDITHRRCRPALLAGHASRRVAFTRERVVPGLPPGAPFGIPPSPAPLSRRSGLASVRVPTRRAPPVVCPRRAHRLHRVAVRPPSDLTRTRTVVWHGGERSERPAAWRRTCVRSGNCGILRDATGTRSPPEGR